MPTNRNLRSVAAALLSALLVVVLLAACPREVDHTTAAPTFDTAVVAPPMAPGPAPEDLGAERSHAVRASRSREREAEAAANAKAIADLERVKARAEQAARDARALVTAERPVVGGDVWGALARCESGGNPRAVGGGGRYFGAFQFSLGSWRAVGMSGNPVDYDYATQLAAAQRLQARSGWGQWPHCSRRLGLR